MILLFLNIRSFCGAHAKPGNSRQDRVNRKKKKTEIIDFRLLIGGILMMLPAHNRSA
jgi:hypothetical protein